MFVFLYVVVLKKIAWELCLKFDVTELGVRVLEFMYVS